MKRSNFRSILRLNAARALALAGLTVLHANASCGGEDSDDPGMGGTLEGGDDAGQVRVDPRFVGTWVVREGSVEQACNTSEPTTVDAKGSEFTVSADEGKLVIVGDDCELELEVLGPVASSPFVQSCTAPVGGGGTVTISYTALRLETSDGKAATLTSTATAVSAAFECELSVTASLMKASQ